MRFTALDGWELTLGIMNLNEHDCDEARVPFFCRDFHYQNHEKIGKKLNITAVLWLHDFERNKLLSQTLPCFLA